MIDGLMATVEVPRQRNFDGMGTIASSSIGGMTFDCPFGPV